jgi:hypothetical protein
MGVPRPDFSRSRPLSAQEAAIMADAALARAGLALRRSPPPRPATRPAVRAVGQWLEPAIIGAVALVCAASCLVHHAG